MPTMEKLKARIAEIAGRQGNVTLDEIRWVVDGLGQNGYKVHTRDAGHATLFRVGSRVFSVCSHNRGSKQVKSCYVKEFLDAMIAERIHEA
jgi:hypothetical protein